MGECAGFEQILKRIPLEAAQEHMKESHNVMGNFLKCDGIGLLGARISQTLITPWYIPSGMLPPRNAQVTWR
jgi:hypothetical protein